MIPGQNLRMQVARYEPEQLPRLDGWQAAHLDAPVRLDEFRTYRVCVPVSDGEVVVRRETVREVLDRAEQVTEADSGG